VELLFVTNRTNSVFIILLSIIQPILTIRSSSVRIGFSMVHLNFANDLSFYIKFLCSLY